MSYIPPIIEQISNDMQVQIENGVYTAVVNAGFLVDKKELLKALQYDRRQYDKGYADGMKNAIPMSDDLELMLVSAVRYALGRRTYIVSTTCNFITCCLDKLSERTLHVIKRDIEVRRDMGDEYLGDECDRMNWINLLDRIQNRLNEVKL